MERRRISSGSPYEPVIGFSRAVRVGEHVHVSGTAPVGLDSEDPYEQTKRCLEIILTALAEAGAGAEDVVRTRIYATSAGDYEEIARAHGEVFGEIRPACTFIVVSALLEPSWVVEIEADATLTE